ncbi:helix-turn-helix domain-containing protein [Paenibacillus sp. FSL H8-0034]|uniref:helix-turn-helix domain-containing protein n=1 Tax=Paenibacillus sp. FSL H8-0034 TaxID=2954671 RepID=UPI0030F848CD
MFYDYDDIVTVETLMEMLCIGRNSAYYLLKSNQIKSVKIGRTYRIPKQSVQEYVLNSFR